jgi:hypothetical protein
MRRRVDESAAALESADVSKHDRLANNQRGIFADSEYLRLLAWEALETSPSEPVNESIRRRFFQQWVDAVAAEQRAGNLPADLDAAQLVLSEFFLVVGPMILPQVTRLVTGRTLTSAENLDRRCEFLERLACHLDATEHEHSH